jgi:hypothetical protein
MIRRECSLSQLLNELLSGFVVSYDTMVTSGQLCFYTDFKFFLAAFCIFTVESKERQTFADLLLSKTQIIRDWVFALHTEVILSWGGEGAISVTEPM